MRSTVSPSVPTSDPVQICLVSVLQQRHRTRLSTCMPKLQLRQPIVLHSQYAELLFVIASALRWLGGSQSVEQSACRLRPTRLLQLLHLHPRANIRTGAQSGQRHARCLSAVMLWYARPCDVCTAPTRQWNIAAPQHVPRVVTLVPMLIRQP
jgi:hypothetical protein